MNDKDNRYAISPCSTCPECDSGDIQKSFLEDAGHDAYYQEVDCWNCGTNWLELNFYGDDEQVG
jgi:hypothetical protein